MSSITSSFFEDSLKNFIDIYYKEIVPRLTKKNKVVAISAAVLLTVLYKVNQIIRPPRNLRHIPYQGYFDFMSSIFKKESPLVKAERFSLPLLDSAKGNGIYLRPGRFAWEAQISNPEAVKKILLKTDTFPKDETVQKFKKALGYKFFGGPNIVTLNGHNWKEQRKLTNPAFHRSMPVALFGKLTQQLFSLIENNGGTAEMNDVMQKWTLDAIGKAGFDFDFNALTDKNSEWVNVYNTIWNGITSPLFIFFPFLDNHLNWLFPHRRMVRRDLNRFLAKIDEMIEMKRKKLQSGQDDNEHWAENEKDLLTLMLEAEMKGEGKMTNEELQSNICIFFIAGHDTTANALSFALYYLAVHPEIQQRAREEAISILGDEPEDVLPTVADTKNMTYINQIIKEVLRINGPVNNISARIAQEDCELAGTFIPKGTQLVINMFDIHHCKKNWSNPLVFDPERFAGDGAQVAGQGMTWVPFGNGGRQCIGMNFSLAEQRVFLSMMLKKYTWRLPADSIHNDGVKIAGIGLVGPTKLNINFTKRY
ncbi:cytochrome P450 [Backusella circina FSU 941]|nr:cytochrome P450 [Backusella circina FSU 941]